MCRSCAAENVAIEGRNLSFWVSTRQGKTVPILKDCSLSIPLGQFWMLLGPNGCGKSTLLKVHRYPSIILVFFRETFVIFVHKDSDFGCSFVADFGWSFESNKRNCGCKEA